MYMFLFGYIFYKLYFNNYFSFKLIHEFSLSFNLIIHFILCYKISFSSKRSQTCCLINFFLTLMVGSYLETTEMEHVYGTIVIFLEVIISYEMNKQVKMM